MSKNSKTNRALAARFASICREETVRFVPEPGHPEIEVDPTELCLCWLACGDRRVRNGRQIAWRYLIAMFSLVRHDRISRIRLFNLLHAAGERYERLEYAFPQIFDLAWSSGPDVWEEHFGVSPGNNDVLRAMMLYSVTFYGPRARDYLRVFARCPTITVGLRREFIEEVCWAEKREQA